MAEFAVRLIAAGVLILLSGWLKQPSFEAALAISLASAFNAAIGYRVENDGHRKPSHAVTLGAIDAILVGCLLASIHLSDSLGFLVLVPVMWSAKRDETGIWIIATAGVLALLLGSALFGGGTLVLLYAQALGVLAATAFETKRSKPTVAPLAFMPLRADVDPQAYLLLRENFRKLKDHCGEVEARSKADHIATQLQECRYPAGERFYARLAEKLQELTGAQSLALYTLSQFEDTLAVRATCGELSAEVETSSFTIEPARVMRQITDNVELTLRSMLSESDRSKVGAVLLQTGTRVVGMVNLFHSDWDQLYEAKRVCEGIAVSLASLIAEEARRAAADKRLKELELLYETAVISFGAANRHELAERIIRRLPQLVRADFIAAYFFVEGGVSLATCAGREVSILDGLSFAGGQGLRGWAQVGFPEVAVFRIDQDQRCNAEILARRRVGSFILIPFNCGAQPFGYLLAASRNSGGLDLPDLLTLRAVAAEFCQAVARMEMPQSGSHGLVSPTSFQALVSAPQDGCLVYLEMLKRAQILETCDGPAIDEAVRAFSFRLHGKLPPGGAACQRRQGEFVVLLPKASEEFARSWANDLAATASLIGVRTAGGRKTMPLAFKAKVATLAPEAQGHHLEMAR